MLEITPLRPDDPAVFQAAFDAIGWNKPAAQYEAYLEEQAADIRPVLVARVEGDFAGYITVVWQTGYAPFREAGIPEIQDFNVLPQFRRQGIGSALMAAVEALIATRSKIAGIGVGLYPDYGPARGSMCCAAMCPTAWGLPRSKSRFWPVKWCV